MFNIKFTKFQQDPEFRVEKDWSYGRCHISIERRLPMGNARGAKTFVCVNPGIDDISLMSELWEIKKDIGELYEKIKGKYNESEIREAIKEIMK